MATDAAKPSKVMSFTHLDGSGPGIKRLGSTKNFRYQGPRGEILRSKEVLERIGSLHVPPAWTDVWISPDQASHLQATGRDAKGRKQYLYHHLWSEERAHKKFDDMLDFARALPNLRLVTGAALVEPGLGRRRVMSLGLRLLDLGLFRIGTERYAEHNHTYGLVSVLREQVEVNEGQAKFDYVAKWAKRRVVVISDAAAVSAIAEQKARIGGPPQLMSFQHSGAWAHVTPDEVNNFLRVEASGPFSAKEFRTWHATVIAATELAVHDPEGVSLTRRKGMVREAIKNVASNLGNTPAVALGSYVDPRVVKQFELGKTIRPAISAAKRLTAERLQERIEAAVIDLLDGAGSP
jgi:DNA topoisomerase IB